LMHIGWISWASRTLSSAVSRSPLAVGGRDPTADLRLMCISPGRGATNAPPPYPLTPPIARPPMMYFWRSRYTSDTGSANMIANALNSDQGVWVAN
jgi:hypothetical protein